MREQSSRGPLKTERPKLIRRHPLYLTPPVPKSKRLKINYGQNDCKGAGAGGRDCASPVGPDKIRDIEPANAAAVNRREGATEQWRAADAASGGEKCRCTSGGLTPLGARRSRRKGRGGPVLVVTAGPVTSCNRPRRRRHEKHRGTLKVGGQTSYLMAGPCLRENAMRFCSTPSIAAEGRTSSGETTRASEIARPTRQVSFSRPYRLRSRRYEYSLCRSKRKKKGAKNRRSQRGRRRKNDHPAHEHQNWQIIVKHKGETMGGSVDGQRSSGRSETG